MKTKKQYEDSWWIIDRAVLGFLVFGMIYCIFTLIS